MPLPPPPPPFLGQLNLFLLKHELLLDLGHVLVRLDHLRVVVGGPQPRGARLLKLPDGLLCRGQGLKGGERSS